MDALQKKVDRASTLEQASTRLAAEESELGRQVQLLTHNQLRLDELSRVDLEKVTTAVDECRTRNNERLILIRFSDQLSGVIGELTDVVAREQAIAIPDKLYDKIDSARTVVVKRDDLTADCKQLLEYAGAIECIRVAEFQVVADIKVTENAIAEAQKLLTVCPHCGQPLTEEARCCLLGTS